MQEAIKLERVSFGRIVKTEYTPWTFGQVLDSQGRAALVELNGHPNDREIAQQIQHMLERLCGHPIRSEREVPARLGLSVDQIRADKPLATAVSALRTAVFELQAKAKGQALTEALGAEPQASVPLYANLNRTIRIDHRPLIYAQAAEAAAAAGFSVLKCAPFEEVNPSTEAASLQPGLDRIAAIQAAVGQDVTLLVDCHSRFDADEALWVGRKLQDLGIGWYEEPLQPKTQTEKLAWLKRELDIPIAGGEDGYGADFFHSLIEQKAVDVIMPDVKYGGGAVAVYKAGKEAVALGGQVSLHCPTGPVSALVSAHVTAALPEALLLEYAPHEVPWRAELVVPPERVENGRFWLPTGAGLGAGLNWKAIEEYGVRWEGESL